MDLLEVLQRDRECCHWGLEGFLVDKISWVVTCFPPSFIQFQCKTLRLREKKYVSDEFEGQN